MNKKRAVLAGLVTFGGLVWTSGAGAQQPPVRQTSATAPAPTAAAQVPPQRPGTAVAIVNINSVLKNYNRAQQLNNQIKTKVEYYSNLMKTKRDDISRKQADLTKPTITQPQREAIEREILAIQRQLQDLDNQARKEIGKEQGDIAIAIFKEIEGVIQAVAAANGFDLVLSYPDATTNTADEMYSQDNVVRKMAAQAAIPLYYKPHIDLTSAVVQTLNARYPAAAVTPTPPTAGTAAPANPARP